MPMLSRPVASPREDSEEATLLFRGYTRGESVLVQLRLDLPDEVLGTASPTTKQYLRSAIRKFRKQKRCKSCTAAST